MKEVQTATEAVCPQEGDLQDPHCPGIPVVLQPTTEEARRHWSKIIGEQIEVTPWTNLFGVEHTKEQKRPWKSFMDYITSHLLMVFQSDAAQTQ